jgi:hypothetical protein
MSIKAVDPVLKIKGGSMKALNLLLDPVRFAQEGFSLIIREGMGDGGWDISTLRTGGTGSHAGVEDRQTI